MSPDFCRCKTKNAPRINQNVIPLVALAYRTQHGDELRRERGDAVPLVVLGVDVRAAPRERQRRLVHARLARDDERRLPDAISRLRVANKTPRRPALRVVVLLLLPVAAESVRVQERLDDVHAALARGAVQRGGPGLIPRVQIGAGFSQRDERVDAAFAGGVVRAPLPALVRAVGVRARGEEEAQALDVAGAARGVNRSPVGLRTRAGSERAGSARAGRRGVRNEGGKGAGRSRDVGSAAAARKNEVGTPTRSSRRPTRGAASRTSSPTFTSARPAGVPRKSSTSSVLPAAVREGGAGEEAGASGVRRASWGPGGAGGGGRRGRGAGGDEREHAPAAAAV